MAKAAEIENESASGGEASNEDEDQESSNEVGENKSRQGSVELLKSPTRQRTPVRATTVIQQVRQSSCFTTHQYPTNR